MNSRNIIRNLTNEECLELIIKGKAEKIECFRMGVLYNPYTNKYIPVDSRDIIKYKDLYYVRDRNMDYEIMQNDKVYHKDGTKETCFFKQP